HRRSRSRPSSGGRGPARWSSTGSGSCRPSSTDRATGSPTPTCAARSRPPWVARPAATASPNVDPVPTADVAVVGGGPGGCDAALLDVARAAGVKVHDGHAVTGASVADGGERIDLDVTGLGTVACRYAVGADGMWSTLRKVLHTPTADHEGYLGEWHAFRQYF